MHRLDGFLSHRPPLLIAAALAGLAAILAGASDQFGPSCVAAIVVAAFLLGRRRGAAERDAAARRTQFHVADELVQYRAFTRLMRDQGERVIALSAEAATALAVGLGEIDRRAAALAARLATLPAEPPDPAALHAEAVAVVEPMVGLFGQLQFQDITQQQLMFLSRLSLLLDDHISDMTRLLGDRRSLDRTTRFKELFDRALGDTVMSSQRHDHHVATGVDLFESAGPTVELFLEGEG